MANAFTTMTNVEQRILSASSKKSILLQTLAETDHAASALQQCKAYLKNLQVEIKIRDKQVVTLSHAKDKELDDHKKYQNSFMLRLAYSLGGKKAAFIAKAGKEEREYFDAVQALYQAETALNLLKGKVETVKSKEEELKSELERHDAAQAELEKLYDSIFAGPTPEFPEEDEKERPMNAAKQVYDQMQLPVHTESQVQTLLQDAKVCIALCLENLVSASDASEMDIWGVGGPFADFSERCPLSQAQRMASEVEMLISQAQRLQPLVQSVGPMNIASGHVMSDIVFDNIFSDLSFDAKLMESMNQVTQASCFLGGEIDASMRRLRELQSDARQAKDALDDARKELLRVRTGFFDRVMKDSHVQVSHMQVSPAQVSSSDGSPAPPAYGESPALPAYAE